MPNNRSIFFIDKNNLALHNCSYISKVSQYVPSYTVMFSLLFLLDQAVTYMRASRKCQICKYLTAKFAYSCCYIQNNRRMKTCHRCLQKNIIQDITLAVLGLNNDPEKQVSCTLCKTKDIRIVNSRGQYLDIDSMIHVKQITISAQVARFFHETTVENMNIRQLNRTHELFDTVLRPFPLQIMLCYTAVYS